MPLPTPPHGWCFWFQFFSTCVLVVLLGITLLLPNQKLCPLFWYPVISSHWLDMAMIIIMAKFGFGIQLGIQYLIVSAYQETLVELWVFGLYYMYMYVFPNYRPCLTFVLLLIVGVRNVSGTWPNLQEGFYQRHSKEGNPCLFLWHIYLHIIAAPWIHPLW